MSAAAEAFRFMDIHLSVMGEADLKRAMASLPADHPDQPKLKRELAIKTKPAS